MSRVTRIVPRLCNSCNNSANGSMCRLSQTYQFWPKGTVFVSVVEPGVGSDRHSIVARSKQAEVRASSEAQVRALARLVELALKRYEAGLAAYFEVVDAQTELLSVEIALAESQRNLLGATVSLYKALGGGWDPEALRAAQAQAMAEPARQ